MRFTQIGMICGAAALFQGMAAAESAFLTGEEVSAEIVGSQLEGRRMGISVKILHDRDGTSTIRSSLRNRDGTWEIVGNELCVLWEGETEAACSSFKRRDRGGYRVEPLGINVKLADSK